MKELAVNNNSGDFSRGQETKKKKKKEKGFMVEWEGMRSFVILPDPAFCAPQAFVFWVVYFLQTPLGQMKFHKRMEL